MAVLSVSHGEELRRLEVMRDVDRGDLPVRAAAQLLRRSERQCVWRLLKEFRAAGAAGLVSKKRGRPSNRRTAASVRAAALWIVRQYYVEFGPTLAAEKLAAEHGFSFSSETLRKSLSLPASCATEINRQSRYPEWLPLNRRPTPRHRAASAAFSVALGRIAADVLAGSGR